MANISTTNMVPDLDINANSVVPVSYQLVEVLQHQIESGGYPLDQRIPSEREIGESFGVSRDTVRRAITRLVRSGHLRKVSRRGTFAHSGWSASRQTAVLRHRLWPNDEDVEVYGRAFERFERTHPEVSVERFSSDLPDEFDIVKLWGTTGNLYADRVLPLSERLVDNPIVKRIPDAALDGFGGRDGLLGIPIIYSGAMLLFNRERFDEAGIALPDATWDWNTLLDAARKLDDPASERFGFLPNAALCALLPFVWQNQGELIDPATGLCAAGSERVIEAMEYFQDLTQASRGVVSRLSPVEEEFAGGRFAMCLWGGRTGSTAHRNGRGDLIGVAPPPSGRTRATSFFGEAIGVRTETSHPEQALALVEELASRQTIRELAAGKNYLVTDPSLQARSKVAQVYRDAIEYTRTDLGPMDLDIFRMLSVGFGKLSGTTPAAEICRQTEQNINAMLAARGAQLQDASW